ncbi:hypothetical protein Z043_115138 [Scleropages formosus]|uniref:Heparan-sulfate 6-O-sulfotransferase n=1 Tax=Scleropages formosus TaxID=113540 RepID=A0A0P7WS04_SCLFO|nr:hypothetical protein Z043_115138 [Scleropages formosus]
MQEMEFQDGSYLLSGRSPCQLRFQHVAPLSGQNFYYITLLRDPVSRYLSEWKHVQRGATWKTSLHMCDGRSPTQDELPACYPGEDWSAFTQINSTRAAGVDVGEDVRQRIEALNMLDVQLYEYAKDLFLQRFQYVRQQERQQERLRRRQERRRLREQRAFLSQQRRENEEDEETIVEPTGDSNLNISIVNIQNEYYIVPVRSKSSFSARDVGWKPKLKALLPFLNEAVRPLRMKPCCPRPQRSAWSERWHLPRDALRCTDRFFILPGPNNPTAPRFN